VFSWKKTENFEKL